MSLLAASWLFTITFDFKLYLNMSITKKTKNKPSTFGMVMVLWLIISVTYIMYDLWKDGLSATYDLGRNSAFSEVVRASQACQPFDVSASVGATQLISVPCLQAAQQQAQQQAANAQTE